MYPGPIGGTERFLVSCPDYLMISPAIREAWAAWAHWGKGAISELYPHGTPCIMLEAVRDLDNGINAGQAEHMKEITKRGNA